VIGATSGVGGAADVGDRRQAVDVNVTDEQSAIGLFEQTGAVDIVVNCAGFSNVDVIVNIPVDEWRSVIDVCLTGSFRTAKHAGRLGAHLTRHPDIIHHIIKVLAQ
jgi:NAD(P)-dependent dehydrogenase (short-subunit alcohol dehydrogenase family)